MIVKDEAHIIRRCLSHALPLIDHVLVVDTGSADGTQQVVLDFLQEHKIPGTVIEEPWRDFAHNRSFALARLREEASVDYGLMIDADNILRFREDFDSAAFKSNLVSDYYDLPLRHGSVSYHLPWLFSNRHPFRFRGVLHEFLETPPGLTRGTVTGFHAEQIQDSARNKNPLKYQSDITVLRKALDEEQDPFMRSRYTFYLAQSYRDAGRRQEALDHYLQRSRLGFWQEEVFISFYQAAQLMQSLGHDDEAVIQAYLTAHQAQPARAEALHGAARLCREKGYFARGYELAKTGLWLSPPSIGLFVENWIYDYGLLDEFAVNAYWAGHYRESHEACVKALNCPCLPEADKARILRNDAFARDKLGIPLQPAPSAIEPARQDLYSLLAPTRKTHVVDIGANPIDGEPPYRPMLLAGICEVTGFEPQAEALAELQRRQGPHDRYLPYAVGDGAEHMLHICRASGMTSCLEPDAARLALFEPFESFGEVTARAPIQTCRLDDIAEIEHMDFLKIDIQGGELAVFQNGIRKLSEAVAVQVEVSFVNLYQNQPSLGEIDLELRAQGFIPHTFAAVKHWAIAPWQPGMGVAGGTNQLLEADMVYVRDFSRPDNLSDEQLKHLALIAHHCYRSFDLALRCILLLETRSAVKAGAQEAYKRLIAAA